MMENKNIYKKFAILVLVVVLCSIVYIIYDEFISKDTSTNIIEENNVIDENNTSSEQSKIEEEEEESPVENNLIFEETFEYYFNKSMHKITFKYYYNDIDDVDDFGEEIKYYISVVVFVDNNRINKEFLSAYGNVDFKNYSKLKEMIIYGAGVFSDGSEMYPNEGVAHPYGRENLNILVSGDKEYLVIDINETGIVVPLGETILIVDDKGTIIKNILIGGSRGIYITDDYNDEDIVAGDDRTSLVPFENSQFYIRREKLFYIDFECPNVYISRISIVNDKVVEKKIAFNMDYISVAGEDCTDE